MYSIHCADMPKDIKELLAEKCQIDVIDVPNLILVFFIHKFLVTLPPTSLVIRYKKHDAYDDEVLENSFGLNCLLFPVLKEDFSQFSICS